jgi:Carboxypeptidase regulatory-like domain
MRYRFFTAVVSALLIAIAALWWFLARPLSVPNGSQPSFGAKVALSARNERIADSAQNPQATRDVGDSRSYQGMADPRWPDYMKRRGTDPDLDWKTPIAFYGKVVDETGKPVAGAVSSIVWTDMSATGSSQREILSDSAGLFSITGIHGKSMTVQVTKPGYDRQKTKSRSIYEYAGFWEPVYHQPDAQNPVVFYMRKKGEPAPLVMGEGKILTSLGLSSVIPAPNGISKGGDSPFRVELIENDLKARRWRVRLISEDGGFVPALEEFPFLAPDSGYEPEITLDQDSRQPPGWADIDKGGWFYFKASGGYGLLEIRQMFGKKTMYYTVRFNPTGSRNLEPGN